MENTIIGEFLDCTVDEEEEAMENERSNDEIDENESEDFETQDLEI